MINGKNDGALSSNEDDDTKAQELMKNIKFFSYFNQNKSRI
jgi:hypothetical protein